MNDPTATLRALLALIAVLAITTAGSGMASLQPLPASSSVALLPIAGGAPPPQEQAEGPEGEAQALDYAEDMNATPGERIAGAAGPQSLFDVLVGPFAREAQVRRLQRLAAEPGYAERVDLELNRSRINFLLFGYGESYEPPFEKLTLIGSHTIISYDRERRAIDLVSITHDTRAPEIERYLKDKGKSDVRPIKIDQGYFVGGRGQGGFDLQRRVLESATGLSIDFQLAFGDEALVDLVDRVFGKVKVRVPKTFEVNSFYLNGYRYPPARFKEGVQLLDGLQCIQFIKTVVKEEDPKHPDRELEHNARKPLVIAGVLEGAKDNAINPLFWRRAADFLDGAIRSGQIAYDFDPSSLLLQNLGNMTLNLVRAPFDRTSAPAMPSTGRKVYIVDQKHGDGALRWVKGDDNPFIRQEFQQGFYLDPNMEVPLKGNPYSQDLVRYYWQPVRDRVKLLLTIDR